MKKNIINEMFFLRAIACLAVVFLHSISSAFENFGIREDPNYSSINNILFAIQILLMFGTPMFVFISEFIISYQYKTKIPDGFFKKRIKFILIPYISMAIFYSVIEMKELEMDSIVLFIVKVMNKIIFGEFHGYFILIIFQFYVLHFLFSKYVAERFKTKSVIIISLLINLSYLAFFNFISPTFFLDSNNQFLIFLWEKQHLTFLGWIAYFVIAYYCGKDYEKFKIILIKYKHIILTSPIVSGLLVLIMCYTGALTYIQSKRVDIVIYTLCIAFFLFYLAMKMGTIHKSFIIISQYSFGVYLIHPFIQQLIERIVPNHFSYFSIILYIIFTFIVSLLLSIFCTNLLNKVNFGKFLVGKIGISNKTQEKQTIKVRSL